jgi:glutamate-ammonia-ligase adenylyltransferase
MNLRTPEQLLPLLAPLCPHLDEETIRDFVTRMDPDYFEHFPLAEVSAHVQLVGQLSPDHLSHVATTRRPDGLMDLVVVAYDYFSEFAIIAGLLSAFGLDIREGNLYTFAEPHSAPGTTSGLSGVVRGRYAAHRFRPNRKAGLSRKKIVDVFRVQPMPGTAFGPAEQEQFTDKLDKMIRHLDAGHVAEARHRVNRLLVETLGRSRSSFSGLLNPVQITFDNTSDPSHTVMDIRSTDTPAFLYAFASALAMRGLSIQRARFENIDRDVHDRFYVRGRHGQKIAEAQEQQELRVTAALTKQFTHVLTWAPDPAKAMDYFDQFLDRIFREARDGSTLKFLKDEKTLGILAKLFGSSEFLWEDFLRRQYGNLLPMLEEYARLPLIRDRAALTRQLQKRLSRIRSDDQRRRTLNQYKDQELFRIDMKHLLDPDSTLKDFSLALTDLAELVLGQTARACMATLSHTFGSPRLASGTACSFAIFGMGKFGGQELGYASDIEVLFVYGGPGRTTGRRPLENSEYFERLVQEILQWIEAKQEGIFHLDVRLRPHGGKGLLANTLDELQSYYSPKGLSAPFERQAVIKLRQVWGDEKLGRQVEAHRDAFVYGGQPWDLPGALDLRRQQLRELVEPGQINVKYSPGGLIDVEYAVQYLQLMHGHQHRSVRTPNTAQAIVALQKARALTAAESRLLHEGYLFLRTLIDGLRIVRGHAKDLVLPPPDSEAFIFLSRRLGYVTDPWQEGARQLADRTREVMEQIERFFAGRFGSVQPRQTH